MCCVYGASVCWILTPKMTVPQKTVCQNFDKWVAIFTPLHSGSLGDITAMIMGICMNRVIPFVALFVHLAMARLRNSHSIPLVEMQLKYIHPHTHPMIRFIDEV